MGKIICFGDIHIHPTHKFSLLTTDGYTTRELEHLSCANTICDLIDKYQDCEKVVFLGDMFGPVGDNISCQSLMVATEIVKRISDKCAEKNINFDMIVGNHDISSYLNNKYSHKLYPFKNYKNVNIYDQPTVIDNFIYMSYCNTDEYPITFLENIKNKEEKVIFSHLEIQYVNLGMGIKTSKGINQELLKKFKQTISGHYHNGVNIAKNINVCGSTQRLSFNDKGIGRNNIIIYDVEKNTITRESFNCPDWICFTDENISDIMNTDINNYISVEVMFDQVLTSEILNKIKQFKGSVIHSQLSRISIKNLNNTMTENKENIQKDNLSVIKDFINKAEVSSDDKTKLLEEGRRLLDSCSSI